MTSATNFLEDRGALGTTVAATISGYLIWRFWKDSSPDLIQAGSVSASKPGLANNTTAGNLAPELNFGPAVENSNHSYLWEQMHDPPPRIDLSKSDPTPATNRDRSWNEGHLFVALTAIYLYLNSK